MLKYVLLGALNYQAATGYQLKQFVDNSARHFWHAETSQIYRTLNSLEEGGLLVSEIQEQEDRPDRRLYQITPTGRANLLAWLSRPMTELQPTKDSLLVRLFFSAQLDKETILTQLRLQRALYQECLPIFQEHLVEQIALGRERRPEMQRDALLWDASRRQGEIMVEGYIRWLDETIARIETEF